MPNGKFFTIFTILQMFATTWSNLLYTCHCHPILNFSVKIYSQFRLKSSYQTESFVILLNLIFTLWKRNVTEMLYHPVGFKLNLD